jgi:hypothetical protein
MSTGSFIAIKTNDSIKSIYCHYDGYLSYNGRILFNNYNTEGKVMALIELGDISCLHESIECPENHSFEYPIPGYTVAYKRDRGDSGCEAETHCCIEELNLMFRQSDCEFIYLFDCKEKKWEYKEYNQKIWHDLKNDL